MSIHFLLTMLIFIIRYFVTAN